MPPWRAPGALNMNVPGPAHHAALGVIIRALQNVDLLAQPRRLADDLPCLARRGAVARDDGQTMRVLPQDAPPAAVLLAVLGPNVVTGRLPAPLIGADPKGLPDDIHARFLL